MELKLATSFLLLKSKGECHYLALARKDREKTGYTK